MSNLYIRFFDAPVPPEASPATAALAAANAYLDNKPARATVRIGRARRDADFWTCPHWATVPIDTWRSEVMTLALARYFAQETTANPELLERLAVACPAVLVKAVRHSGLVLTHSPVRRAELAALGERHPDVAELCRVLFIFAQAYLERLEALEAHRAAFARTTPFELLILASLHAFEHLVPRAMVASHRPDGVLTADEAAWSALHEVFLWKLAHATPEDFVLDEAVMGRLLARHLAPVLQCLPGREDAGAALRRRFADLVDAQVELHAFVSQSADAFSYDDGIRFERHGTTLEIVEVDAALREAWRRDGRKLVRLHGYWFYRAADDFVASGMATVTLGRPENQEANQLAYLRALRTRLQLTQVYGIAEAVTTDTGDAVDVFQAALSLELMSAFFQRDFLEAFMSHLRRVKDWRVALRLLAEGGARRTAEPISADLVRSRGQDREHHRVDGDAGIAKRRCPHGGRHPRLLEQRLGCVVDAPDRGGEGRAAQQPWPAARAARAARAEIRGTARATALARGLAEQHHGCHQQPPAAGSPAP